MKLMGIDEAGRGSIIGPLVIAGFMVDKAKEPELVKLGVKDSKQLTPEKRDELYKQLVKLGDYAVIIVKPSEIDKRFEQGSNLNRLELLKAARIIKTLKPDEAVIDSPSTNTRRFKLELDEQLSSDCRTVCENKADVNHPVVSAASIIAKVTRDKEVKRIEGETGEDIGKGYPSDERSIAFVKKALSTGKWMNHVRRTWETFTRIKAEKEQKRLSDF